MLSPYSSRWLWWLILEFWYPITLGGYACLNNPCIHGVCIDDLNTSYSCYCIDGYTGIQCQINWDECWSNPCQNGGICHDGIAMFNCSCPAGFVGNLCDENYDECDSNPCLNNGTCIDGNNGYTCFCQYGYSGRHCEIDVAVCNATNITRCSNGGICEEGPGVEFTCRCQPGWAGSACQTEINECMSAPCQNGAVCIDLHADYACACVFGYTGKDCDEIVLQCEDNPCKNNALCLTEEELPICYCVPDYHGDRCQFQYDECQLGKRCMNGGTCIDGIANFTCSCPPDLTGDYCECLILGENLVDCTYTVVTNTKTTSQATPSVTITNTPMTIITEETPIHFNITTVTTTQVPNISNVYTENNTSSMSTFSEGDSNNTVTASYFINTTLSETTIGESLPTSRTRIVTLPTITTELQTQTKEVIETTYSLWNGKTTTETWTSAEISTNSTEKSSVTIEEIQPTIYITSTEVDNTSLSSTSTIMSSLPLTTSFLSTSPEYTITLTDHISTTTESMKSTTKEFPHTTTTSLEKTTPPEISITTMETVTDLSITVFSVTTLLTDEPKTNTLEMETKTIIPETSSYFAEYTTTNNENVTKLITDCTKLENACENGGTCTYTNGHYKCVCPYDAEGVLCEIHLGIQNAAFIGSSYLVHRLSNTSGIKIEFTAKTLSPSGLIFYSEIDTSYMALHLENGHLKFIFSCGYQTMLLSELRNPINDGFSMNIRAILEFSKTLRRCNATVIVNNTLAMSGNQIVAVNLLIKPISVLYLGGLPEEKLKDHIPAVGFIGCITDLKIFDRPEDIFKNAEDGYQISECSSLACLSNPCNNGGSCIENKDLLFCHCKNGYLGKYCESSVCDNNPCYFGATCLPFTGSGYICLCPFGKRGHFCENDMEIMEPNFSSSLKGISSYAAYPLPTGGISNNMELKFRFIPNTMDQISILMFIGQSGQHDDSSDHMAVSFVKGYIMLTWNLGSGPRRIFTSKPLSRGPSNYLLKLGRFGRRAWLSVDNLGNITGRSPGNLAQLDVAPILYLGGHNSPNFSILPHDLPLHSGFSGCIFEVELKSGNLVIPLQSSRQVIGRSLGQCGTTECHEKLCQNGGACLYHGGTFSCLCQDGWYGPLCLSKYNPCDYGRNNCSADSKCVPLLSGFECDCPVGKTGSSCDIDEKLSDVSLSGKRSYISLKPIAFEAQTFTIELQIRPLRDRGLILYIGKSTQSFLSLGIHSGLLELKALPVQRKHNTNEILSIRSNTLLAIGIWYKIRLGKYGNKLYLRVENVVNTSVLRNGDVLRISGEIIYLGGLPDMSQLPSTATSTLAVPFTGCIRQLIINSHHIPLTAEHITNGQNIADCDGTPCGGDACENGGTCVLDSNLNPYCSCNEPYIGEKCENIPSCQETVCQNKGRCVDTKCVCIVGYTGVFCETEILVHTPQFIGKSHLILKKIISDKKRDLSNTVLHNLELNFTTTEKYGLLLWSSKKENFLGIGIENGYIKVAYTLSTINKPAIENPPTKVVADGLWHSVEISLHPPHLQIRVDRKLLEIRNINVNVSKSLLTDSNFYLGGLPRGESLNNRTYGLFSKSFVGCIATVAFNKETVTEFSIFEGENIGICNIF